MDLAHGFADKEFHRMCENCKVLIDHNMLRAQKFRKDLELLLLKDVPMPGTVLDINGTMPRIFTELSH